jgi:hypothetical protein
MSASMVSRLGKARRSKACRARARAVVSIVAGADRLAINVLPVIRALQRTGVSTLRGIAAYST